MVCLLLFSFFIFFSLIICSTRKADYYAVFVCGYFSLPGPPLTEKTAIEVLLEHDVAVGIGSYTAAGAWVSRNLRWDAGWVSSILLLLP